MAPPRRLRRRCRTAPRSAPARIPDCGPTRAPPSVSARTCRSGVAREPRPGPARPTRSRLRRAPRARSVRAHRLVATCPTAAPTRSGTAPARRPGCARSESAGTRLTVGSPPGPGTACAPRRAATSVRADHSSAPGGACPAAPPSRRRAERTRESVGAALAGCLGGDDPVRAHHGGAHLPVPGSARRTHRTSDTAVCRGRPADSRHPPGAPGSRRHPGSAGSGRDRGSTGPRCDPASAGNLRSTGRRSRRDAGTAPCPRCRTPGPGDLRHVRAPAALRSPGGNAGSTANAGNAGNGTHGRCAGAREAGGASGAGPGVLGRRSACRARLSAVRPRTSGPATTQRGRRASSAATTGAERGRHASGPASAGTGRRRETTTVPADTRHCWRPATDTRHCWRPAADVRHCRRLAADAG